MVVVVLVVVVVYNRCVHLVSVSNENIHKPNGAVFVCVFVYVEFVYDISLRLEETCVFMSVCV